MGSTRGAAIARSLVWANYTPKTRCIRGHLIGNEVDIKTGKRQQCKKCKVIHSTDYNIRMKERGL